MSDYRYIFEPYKGMNTRYICPKCKNRTFVRYIDTVTNQHLADFVGKCERLNNCGYLFTCQQYLKDNKPLFEQQVNRKEFIKPKKNHSLIPNNYFLDSLKKYEANNFVKFLLHQFGNEVTDQLIKKYAIGTSKHWPGATVFWQLDRGNKIRTGKVMLYDTNSGKRIKEPYSHITWVHSLLKNPDTKQCLFGEHLLNNDVTLPVAIVESEKTAIIASHYLPEFIWLSCGSATGLSYERCKVLQGRKVVLFPDLNCYEAWSKKAKELSPIAHFSTSDFLEQNASDTERKQGLDIADYLVNNP